MKKETIWILGGMWPEASCYLYKNIIEHYQNKYWAKQDIDYPHLMINNIWLSGFTEKWIVDSEKVKLWLLDWILDLDNAGVDKIIMACNTVHLFYDFLQKSSKWNIINLLSECTQQIKQAWHKKVLILGSSTTNFMNLYDTYLDKLSIRYLKLDMWEQLYIDKIIENIMWWNIVENDKKYLLELCNQYSKLWATWCIVWCTELPLVMKQDANPLELFDTLSILTDIVDDIDHKI